METHSLIKENTLTAQYDTPDDEYYMHLALEEADYAAELGEVPIGAVVVSADGVVVRAHNRREVDHDPSAHAEFIALREAAQQLGRWRLSDCTVYVTLEPCPMCAGLMQQARIKRCVFAAADPKSGALGTLYRLHDDSRLNHSFQVTSGVLADESSKLLQDFFSRLRKNRS
ncbi:MAG: tRNA adenosine(34) deaminase TadA [Coriobacteriia bacterium]|nr:tRNA adenosine(34) deaminase TadA [Coriobacteriia bacterium]